ncbi:MAG: hypothetical protein AAFR12_22040, partial [Cyanobacteria bacterium J06626_6]
MRPRHNWLKRISVTCALTISTAFVAACSTPSEPTASGEAAPAESTSAGSNSGKKIRISIGTQDQVINTAVGGATVRACASRLSRCCFSRCG